MFRFLRPPAPPKTPARVTPTRDHLDLLAGESIVRIVLRRHSASARISLRVRAADGAVVLTMPLRTPLAQAQAFAHKHRDWIASRLARIPEGVDFVPGAIIPIRGVAHVIMHRPRLRNAVWVEALPASSVALDKAAMALCVAGSPADVPRRVQDYLKREAKHDLTLSVERHARAIGLTARKITLRDQRSRWGSCSSTGSLNFSWRLILAPGHVLDYLAAHEVAHLKHMDHSDRFWTLTHQLCPGTDKAEAWLKQNGASLYRFGAAKPAGQKTAAGTAA